MLLFSSETLNIRVNSYIARCFVWMWNMVFYFEEHKLQVFQNKCAEKYHEGLCEQFWMLGG
jgi:hypothetical protein